MNTNRARMMAAMYAVTVAALETPTNFGYTETPKPQYGRHPHRIGSHVQRSRKMRSTAKKRKKAEVLRKRAIRRRERV